MAYNDPNPTEHTGEPADTASFKRFVEQEDSGGPVQTGGSGRGFRLVTLAVGALVLVAIVVLLLR
jgi:hypothetical protein